MAVAIPCPRRTRRAVEDNAERTIPALPWAVLDLSGASMHQPLQDGVVASWIGSDTWSSIVCSHPDQLDGTPIAGVILECGDPTADHSVGALVQYFRSHDPAATNCTRTRAGLVPVPVWVVQIGKYKQPVMRKPRNVLADRSEIVAVRLCCVELAGSSESGGRAIPWDAGRTLWTEPIAPGDGYVTDTYRFRVENAWPKTPMAA